MAFRCCERLVVISFRRSVFLAVIFQLVFLVLCTTSSKPIYTEASSARQVASNNVTTTAAATSQPKRVVRDVLSESLRLSPQTPLARLIYDDNYMRKNLASRFPYLVQPNGSYLGIREYFNFDRVFWPTGEYLERINIEQMLYEEMRALEITSSLGSVDIWHYSDERELAASGGHLADAAQCRATLGVLARELEQASENPGHLFKPGTRNMELLRWIDAWGRPVSETYQGSSFWPGSYRACRNLALDGLNTTTTTRFNYCWAKVAARDWPADDVMRPRMSVRVGVCLPDACDTREARALGPTILKIMHFNFAPMHRERYTRLLDLHCLPVRPEPSNGALSALPLVGGLAQLVSTLPKEAQVYLLLCSIWLTVIAVCSLRECCRTSGLASGWTRLLSFQENYRVLTSDDAPPASSRVDMRPLGVPRLIASLLVLAGHSFIYNYYFHFSPHLHIIEGRKLGYHLFIYSWKSLEIFFVLSGILTSYTVLSKFAPKNQMHTIIRPRVWLALNLVRFLRTAPLMMVIWTFVRFIYLHLGEGPYWDYGTNKQTFMSQCQHISWWRWLVYPIIADPLGLTGDPYQHECMSQSWYIVTDLKMFLVVPLYIYISYSRPKWRWPMLIGALGVSTAWRYAHLHLQQLVHPRQIYTYGEMHAIHIFITFLDSAYYSPVDRFQALAMGLTAGLYLYKYKLGHLRRWPWWMRGKLPLVAMVGWLVFDLTRRLTHEIYFRQTGHIPSEAYIRAWLVLGPRLDALVFTLVALRLCTDWAPRVMRHALVFYKLSKISYCVYVVHTLIILYAISSHERARPDTMAVQIFMLIAYVGTLSFLIAFPLYLFVESPLTLLLNRIMAALVSPRIKSQLTSGSAAKQSVTGGGRLDGRSAAAAAADKKSK